MDSFNFTWGVFGACMTGFFFLVGWIKSIESKTANIEIIQKDVKEIKEALLGTMDKKGVITKVHDQEIEIDSIKKICNERHYNKESYAKA